MGKVGKTSETSSIQLLKCRNQLPEGRSAQHYPEMFEVVRNRLKLTSKQKPVNEVRKLKDKQHHKHIALDNSERLRTTSDDSG